MRVLLDVSAVPARPAGAGVYTCALAAGLARHEAVDLHLVARRDDAARWADIAPEAEIHPDVPAPRPLRIVWEQTQARRLAARVGADVWHGPHYTMPLQSSVPVVVTVHDLTFFDHPEWHERAKVPYFRRMIREGARRAAAVICISQYTADRLAQVAPPRGRVVVARHGVDHDRFRIEGDAADDRERIARHGITPPFVAFVGTIEPRKNLPNLVTAFARLADDHPDLRLALVGSDGWGALAVRDAVAASGVATRVIRTGYVDDAVVPALFRCAECAVYPAFEEGFGVPALEALACGAPLVTSAGSALAEVVGAAALTVDPTDVDALAAALRALVDGSERAAALRASGPIRARAFTWEQSVETHVSVYREVAAARAARMKAFVTGAHGFAGRHLVAHLRASGDDVATLDRHGDHPVDIVDRDAVHDTLRRSGPDVLYHLAAFTHVGQSFAEPTLSLRVNVEGTANVLDAARTVGVQRVVVVGSAEEYGFVRSEDLPLREDAPLRPASPYAVSKVAASYLALQAWLGGGLETIRVRAFNHTGPGQSDQFLVAALAQRIARAERDRTDEVAVGSLDPVRDLNDVRDVVRAYRLLAERGVPGEVYNVCTGTGISVAGIAEQLVAHACRPLRVVQDPELVRPVDIPELVGDPSKLRAATGWEPEYTLDQTLADVLTSARAALNA